MADIDISVEVLSSPQINVEIMPAIEMPLEVAGDVHIDVDVAAIGPQGADGADGAPGVGVPTGGTTGQVLAKNSVTDYDTEWVDAAAGGGAVDSVNAQTGVVVLDQDDIGDGTTYKQYSQTEKTKLAGVATGATANDTDANLKARANHTGTQTASTISDFSTAADARISAATGVSVQGYSANTTTLGNTTTGTGAIVRATSPAITTPTGIVKGDVGLGNVDNTSDATKNAASATLTNKTISGASNTLTNIAQASVTNLTSDLAGKASTSHTHAIDDLSDVTISAPGVGEVLKYNGSAWINDTDATSGGGVGATNLSATLSSSQTVINSDTGTDATIPAVDGTNAGVMTPTMKTKLDGIETAADVTDAANVSAAGAFMKSTDDLDDITDGTTNKAFTSTEKTKLSGIASGATANDTDANLKDRANHTGTQTASTISDFNTAADARVAAAVVSNTGAKTYNPNTLLMAGSTSGTVTLNAPAVAGSSVLTTPSGTDTLAGLAAVQTITGAWSFNDDKLKLNGLTSGTTTLKASAAAGTTTVTFPATTGTVYVTGGTDVSVADGGTGRSTSTTAYGLIAAGTTATGAHQTLAAGATTDILVGGGASALPVWTAATGTGSPVRATSPTLTTPRLGSAGFIADANGNEVLLTAATVASAVNEVTITNAATGVEPKLSATGGDTNINLGLSGKGTGAPLALGSQGMGILGSGSTPATPASGIGKFAMAGTGAVRPTFINSGGVVENVITDQHSSYTAWSSWTPTRTAITVGNGTEVAVYKEIGKTVHFYYCLTLGSTSTVGSDSKLSAPVPFSSNMVTNSAMIGQVVFQDVSAGTFFLGSLLVSASSTIFPIKYQVSGSNIIAFGTSSTSPMTWATGDIYSVAGTYERS